MENLNAEQIRYKMSDKQIKTALECLSKANSSAADREKCYFMWKEPSCFSCYHEVAQNALALITSQEQRIKELAEENAFLRATKNLHEAEYNEIKSKCELREAENERLIDECGNQSVLWKQHFESLYETAKETVKADTVRKMQERLKAEKITHKTFGELVYVEDIDQIAKEIENE